MNDIVCYLKKSLFFCLIFIGGVALGLLLLCVVNILPTERMALHVRGSASAIANEGDYWSIVHGDNTATLDNYTDAIILLNSAYDGPQNVLEKTLYNFRVYKKDASKGESIAACGVLDSKDMKVVNYYWYWCGYQVFMKPLLLLMNLSGIRRLNALIILFEICILSLFLQKRNRTIFIMPFLISVAFMNVPAVMMSLQFSTVIHIALISSMIALIFAKYENTKYQFAFFMLVGMVTSYMDFLTAPVLTLIYPMWIYILLSKENRFIKFASKVIINSVQWSVGYLGMWVSKWVLGNALTDDDFIKKGLERILLRTGDEMEDSSHIDNAAVFSFIKGYLLDSHFFKICIILFM